jgi:predicted hydrolase (HD superfamily)
MTTRMPSRTEALDLLRQWNQNESLIKHALAVEGVMRLMARRRGEDEEAWGIVGLVHDLDYERHPEAHCAKSREILTEQGWPESLVRAVVSHGWGICSDVEPVSGMEKTLYAVDELVGLVTAAALVRPSRSILDLEPSSVAKKWKDKRFAAGANREVIEKGAQMLGLPLADLMAEVIAGMREVADAIDLRGTL